MEKQTIIKYNFEPESFVSLIDLIKNDGFKLKEEVVSDDIRVFRFLFIRTINDLSQTIGIYYSYISKRLWVEIEN